MKSCCFCKTLLCLQTKGVKNIVTIKAADAAMWAAVGGACACVLSVLVIWPLMRRSLQQYDHAHAEADKGLEGQGKGTEAYRTAEVQEDRCVAVRAGWNTWYCQCSDVHAMSAQVSRCRITAMCRHVLSRETIAPVWLHRLCASKRTLCLTHTNAC